MAPEFEHLAVTLEQATEPILSELRGRLEGDPSESDWLAISTAVAKAALEGLRRGAEEFAAQVEEALPAGSHISWDLDLRCEDVWAERHAGGARRGRMERASRG